MTHECMDIVELIPFIFRVAEWYSYIITSGLITFGVEGGAIHTWGQTEGTTFCYLGELT